MTSGSARIASTMRDRMSSIDAAEIAHREPEGRAEDRAEQRRERRHREDVARADDDAGEDVAAEQVGAEAVLGRRRLVLADRVVA